ncbi:MAG: hypothetical protein KatS3mg003_1112 [Candidatus Nitrosocaldaceae archaeon]|nr:MAG: hypothetical protein KatS3mg003_1112 [Candidatus Nitrosocaldaceae archaeon]
MNEEDIGELITNYSELVEELKLMFPHVDLKIIFELMSHRLLHPDHKPTVRLEIFYKYGVDLDSKAEKLAEITGVLATVYKDEHRLVIEPRIELEDLREIAKDNDIESLAGDIMCCLDTLISRRKVG